MKEKRNYFLVGIIILVVFGLGFLLFWQKVISPVQNQSQNGNERNEIAEKWNLIRVSNLEPNQAITSPLYFEGEARGFWFFEASFPVRILDGNGKEIAVVPTKAGREWMTEDFVPFSIYLEFDKPMTERGTVVFEKDNPSGLPENADSLKIPVIFGVSPKKTKTVKVFFGNNNLNPGAADCGLVFPVSRVIPETQAVARAAIEELLKGTTNRDAGKGYFTSLASGVKIRSLVIENGTAKIDFDEQLEYQMGGSCRVTAIRSQITQTLKQFPSVRDVLISVNGRTEDILQP